MDLSYNEIINNIKRKIYHPLYLLAGEESFFIDNISDFIEKNVLTEEEKEFNLSVLYGRDIDCTNIIDYAKRYPMMSNYQVVIVKEAQDINKIDNLASYLENPLSSTLLVLCHKKKSPDKRKSFYKSIKKNGICFESNRIHINKIPDWIKQYVSSLGYRISNKASMLITEFVGNDISKITNEIDKLSINLEKGIEINDTHIEDNIGISKDYNVFELLKALQYKDIYKSNKIIFYFASNPKEHSIFSVLPLLFDFFTKTLIYQENYNKKNQKELMSIMGISSFMIDQYQNASRHYSRDKIIRIIGYLRDYDLKAKGVNNASTIEGELLKELLFKILH